MSVFEQSASKRRRDELDAPSRATCLRCRREYTPEPDAAGHGDYCWWCAARVSQAELFVVTE